MSPAAERERARWDIRMAENGRVIQVRRLPSTDAPVRALIMGYQPNELVGGIKQKDRKVVILAEDVEKAVAANWPGPIRDTDKLMIDGKPVSIGVVDDWTLRLGDTLIAYQISATG